MRPSDDCLMKKFSKARFCTLTYCWSLSLLLLSSDQLLQIDLSLSQELNSWRCFSAYLNIFNQTFRPRPNPSADVSLPLLFSTNSSLSVSRYSFQHSWTSFLVFGLKENVFRQDDAPPLFDWSILSEYNLRGECVLVLYRATFTQGHRLVFLRLLLWVVSYSSFVTYSVFDASLMKLERASFEICSESVIVFDLVLIYRNAQTWQKEKRII